MNLVIYCIPSNYTSTSEALTLQGLRLIALGYKEIHESEIDTYYFKNDKF